MRRALLPLLLVAGSLPLGGCVAGIAMGAVGAAVRAATPERPEVIQDLGPAATAACEERAAPLGRVHIIDVDQRPDGRVTVWGTVQDDSQRRSFECRWDRVVKAFKLRPIPTR